MDWSSSQWKEGLSSTALQKINALEEKIEKLQKERQQKQTQFECLELLLDKEKRKVEQEKQQTSRLERELQSVADTCKNLENKQQKLLIEIQNRDSRQNHLEAQLAQAKKQNCRLQQLEKDIEELRCLRENTKLEHKELEEKLKKEQSTIVKQNDAITDLEQTIKSLQEKSFSSSLIVISDNKSMTMDANKENIDTFQSIGDDKNSESLRKKILEQENIINNLKEQLKNTSSGKDKMGPPSDILSPVKTNTSERSANNSFSVWDSFGTTPSKAGKAMKHHSDSSAFDDSDEKVRNLQLKVKQLSQELECQRHNSEAAKNALEQRLKEKENALKAEIKQQAQEIHDLDKELREIQNKYQQDVVQTSKKLDIVNAQLQKSELLKQQMEKDLKTLELQINSRNSELQQKNEELNDLQKIKNNYEATAKKLNSEKRELEQSINALQAQKNSWHEEVRDLKMQLEGSNNLVKEKETLLHNMKKENDHLSRVNLEFQTKIQAINKELSVTQSEKCQLEKKLQDFDADMTSLKENLKVISDEKKNICSLLDLEKAKSAKLEFDLMTNKKDKVSLQSEVENKEKLIDSLKAELEQLKNNSDVKIKMLENTITTSSAEISSLKNKLTEFTNKEMSMQETIKQLKDKNDKIANSLEVVNSEKTSMESHIKELTSQLTLLQTDNKSKDEKMNLLKKEAADMKENYEVKIKILENTVTTSSAEISSLNSKLSEFAKNEMFMQETVKQLKDESNKIVDSLKVANSEKASMESHIKELMSQLTLLQIDNKSKIEKINQLNKDAADLKENYEVQVTKLGNSVASYSAEISSLKEKLGEFTKNEKSMQETIKQLKEENSKITDSLKVLNSEKTSMESHTKELTSQLVLLQTDNKSKDEKINQLKKEAAHSKENYEVKITELGNSVASSSVEISSLKEKLGEFTKNEMSMQEIIKQLKEENNKVKDSLKALNSEKTSMESHTKELTSQLVLLQTENKSKDEKINQLKKEAADLKENYEVQVTKLENSVASSSAEISSLKEKLSEFTKNEISMQETIKQLKEENSKITDSLKVLNSEKTSMESYSKELTSQLVLVQTDNKSKDEKINQLKKEAADLKENYEVQLTKLGNSVASSSVEISSLKEKLGEFTKNEISMQETTKQLKEENGKITDSLKVLNSEKTSMESHTKELTSQLVLLQTDNKSKDDKINQLKKEAADLKENYAVQVTKLENSVASSSAEISSLKEKLSEFTMNEMSMQETIKQLNEEINKITDSLKVLSSEKTSMESHTKELTSQLVLLQTDNKSKDEKINQLKKEAADLIENYEVKVTELGNSVASSGAEILSLKEKLGEFTKNEMSMQETIKQLKEENNKITDSLKVLNSEKTSMESHTKEFTSQLVLLQTDNKSKDEKINQLKKEAADLEESYEMKVQELEESLNSTNAEILSLKEKLSKYSENELTLQEKLEQLQAENSEIKNSLKVVNSEKASIDSHIEGLVSQLTALQTDNKLKEDKIILLIKEAADLKENYDKTIDELKKSVNSYSAENSSLQKKLVESTEKNISVQESMSKLEEENKRISSLLNDMEAMESSTQEMKSQMNAVQTTVASKEEELAKLRGEFADLEKNYNEQIKEIEKEKLGVVDSLSSENTKNAELENIVKELNIKISDLQSDLDIKKELLNSLSTEMSNCKETYKAKLLELRKTMEALKSENDSISSQTIMYLSNENNLKETLEKIENEKKIISDTLVSETEKGKMLESQVEQLKNNISELEYDVVSDVGNELSLKTEIISLKEDYEAKFLEYKNTLETLKSHNESLLNQVKDFVLNELSVREALEKAENEKNRISDVLSTETKKTQLLESKVVSLTNNLMSETKKTQLLESKVVNLMNNLTSQEYFVISKIANELVLNTEMERIKENFKNKISELQLSNESLTSKVFTLQEELKENSLREISFIKRLEETKVECQNVSALTSSESELRKRVEDLLAELSQKNERINSLEIEISSLIKNHEVKVQDLETSLNSVNAKIFSLQDKLHEFSENELTMQEKFKQLQLENTETTNSFKVVNSEKVSMESYIKELVSQLTALQTDNKLKEEKIILLIKEAEDLKENYDKEKAKINANIEDVKMSLLSMLDSMSNIAAQSETLQNEICCIKEECQETQLKITCDQKARLELLYDLLNQLNTVENHVEVLVFNYEGEISLLKTQLCEVESQIAAKSEEHSGWFKEKENLLAKMKCIEDKLNLKELELENSILNSNEYLVTIENVKDDNVMLTLENKKLQEEISRLKDEFHAMDSLIATKNSEYENILDEKTAVYEELKLIEGKLREKESDLEDLILFKKEQVDVTESLNSMKEKLEQENKQLVNEMSNLKSKLSEMESQRAAKCLEYEIISKENVNLHQKVKLLEQRLKGKELELQNNSSLTNEMSTIIEGLEDVKKTLILENTELQDEISCLKNKIVEIELGCEDISKKYLLVEEEKKNLMEKIRLMEKEISEKKSTLLNTHKQLVAIENLKNTKENLTHEKTELQVKLSSLSGIMMTAENVLQNISSKIADVLLNSKNEFAAVQLLQEQSFKSSKDISNFTSDYIRDKNAVQAKIKEIEEVCEFVLESLSIFQDHYTSCQNMDIPECIKLEIQHIDSSEIISKDSSSNYITYCDGDTVHYSYATERSVEKFKEELDHNFKDVYNKTSSFEERILAAKERFKFLVHHQLVATDDFRKMHVTLKYMKKLYIVLHSKKIALESIKSGYQLLQPKHESCEDVFNLINLLSSNCNANNDVNSYFEKCLLVNTYKDLYLASKMKKVLNSFKSFIDPEILNFEQHFTCYEQYDNVDYHYLHKPVVIKMDYLLFLHRLNVDFFHKEKKLINSVVNHGKKLNIFEIRTFLDSICAAKVPLIVNCLFKLHERSLSKIDENSVNINLISHIVKKLMFFYAENHPSMSSGTCIHIENFLYLLSKISSYNINEKHFVLLQNLMYSLLEDLLLMTESFNNEKEQTEDLFDVLVNEMDNLKSENTDKQNQILLLEESLMEERRQKQILDLRANEIVENLNSVVILKKNWESKVLEISKLCSVLKNIFDCNNINECDILKLQSECAALSDNFCLCEECLATESESTCSVNHIAFTPVNLIHFVAELYMSKTDTEKEIMQLKATNTDISQKIIMLKSELENARLEHSTLEQSMCGLKEKLDAKEYELDRLRSKCSCLEDEYQSLNTQFLEINSKYKDLQKTFDDKSCELNKCKQQYEELFAENEQIRDGIILKEQKIAQCEQTILEHSILKKSLGELQEKVDTKECELENLKTKYSCLENKYQNLNIQFLEKDSEHKDVDNAFNDKLNELNKCKQQYQELLSENQKIKEEITLKEEKIAQYEKTISEHSTLEQCLCELKEKISVKDHELENLKTKYLCLEDEYQSLNAQVLETNIRSKDLQKAFDDKLNELNECKQQYQELFSENKRIKDEVILKEQKMAQYEKTSSEKMSEYETLLAKSADYEARINDLNNTINSLTSHVKESNNKLANLEKANSLLNTTLENVEEELQNTYSEKQKLEENLQEKNSEIERLQQEISSTNNKITNGENEISNLKITIKELKDTLKGNEKEYAELKSKNCKLQNEICSLTKLIKELKVSIIEKNLSIQKNESTVSELKKIISEYDDEKKNLEMKVMILSDELEKKISLSYNLESKLDRTTAEKDDLEKQIADLLSMKYSKAQMLEDENSYKTKCDQFTSENSSLRLEIENLTQEKINLENKIKAYCDKICTLEEELKKAAQLQESLSHERDDLKKNLHILKRDMQIKNKSHVENSLLMQELAQKVDKLRNELSESGQIAAKKIKELSQENSSLHAEICLLKSQSNVDYKNNTNSVIDTSNFKYSNNLKEFLKKFVDVLAEAIKSIECNNDIGKYKSEFLSQLGKWEDNITDSDSYISDIYKKLHSFLQHYISMQKDLESKLDNLAKAAFKHVVELNKYCEESEEGMNCFNVTALGEISCLNETMYSDSTTSISCDINKLTHELQNSCQKLSTRFNSMRTTILKREMEIKSLQDDLSEMQQLKENLPNGEQNADTKVQALESKCKMLLSNAHRLEKKHINLLKTCEEMENNIKTLQKEKQELENEAEEMATILRDQTSSDEVLEISIRLAEKSKQLEHLKEENSCLKSHLKRYESFVKENSLSVSKIAEQSQSDSS